MSRYYFNVKDGETILDNEGIELPGMEAVREEALATSLEILRGMHGLADHWSREPWRLWVTDQPSGAGKTVLTLEFSAKNGDGKGAGRKRRILETAGVAAHD
jgi:hypothetical protein